MKTRLTLRLEDRPNSRLSVNRLSRRLDFLHGRAIGVRFRPALSAGSRKQYSRRSYGQPVYAATFIRKRRVILDLELASKPREFARILTHELFHFAWVRLGNTKRKDFEALLDWEWRRHASGELGWSAESRKLRLKRKRSKRAWRDYACESFCDTAAWLYSGVHRHPEYTLAPRHRSRRAAWFQSAFSHHTIPI